MDTEGSNRDVMHSNPDNVLYVAMNRSPRKPEDPVYHTGTYVCDSCQVSFKTLLLLKKHNCSSQREGSKDDEQAQQALNKQTQETAAVGRTEKVSASVQENRKEGEVEAEMRQNYYRCHECGKTYVKQNCYLKHVASHKGKNQWQCFRCCKEFKSATKLKEHSMEHGISKPFKCSKCASCFATPEVLRVHGRTHTGERPFACTVCDKRFKQSSNLQDHLRKHKNERAFICGTCDKSFNLKGDLTKHLLLHSGEKPFSCHICSKCFPGVSNLNRHIATHSSVKPFVCSHCGKPFGRKEKLKEHERIHTGEKPFVCNTCGKSFSDSGNFANHKKAHLHPESAKWRLYPKKQHAISSKSSPSYNENVQKKIVIDSLDNVLASHSLSESQPGTSVENQEQASFTVPNDMIFVVGQTNASAMLYYIAKPSHDILPRDSDQSTDEKPLMLQIKNIASNLEQFQDCFKIDEASDVGSSYGQPARPETEVVPADVAMNVDSNLLQPGSDVDNESTSPLLCLSPPGLGSGYKLFETSSNVLAGLRTVSSDDVLKNLTSPSKMFSLLPKDLVTTSTNVIGQSNPHTSAVFALIEGCTDNYQHQETQSHTDNVAAGANSSEDSLKELSGEQSTTSSLSNPQNLFQNLGLSLGSANELPEPVSAAVFSLNDFAKVDDAQVYSLHPGYELTSDVEGSAMNTGEELLAAPMKANENGCHTADTRSQVLVTPDRFAGKEHVVDRSNVIPRALQL